MSETAAPEAAAAAKAPSSLFGFVKVIVRDLPRAIDFYRRVLGLEVSTTFDFPHITEKVMRKPGQTTGPSIVLYLWKDGREITVGNGWGPLGFYVRDVDAAYAHALAEGATPSREPFDAGASRVAFVLDPDGHEIEFISMKR